MHKKMVCPRTLDGICKFEGCTHYEIHTYQGKNTCANQCLGKHSNGELMFIKHPTKCREATEAEIIVSEY